MIGEVPVLGGEVQRYRVVALVADVGIGATFEEAPNDSLVRDAEVQRGPQPGVAGEDAALVDEIGMRRRGARRRARHRLGPPPREERSAACRTARLARCGERRLEGDPALMPVLARERMLNVAKARLGRRLWVGAARGAHAPADRSRGALSASASPLS